MVSTYLKPDWESFGGPMGEKGTNVSFFWGSIQYTLDAWSHLREIFHIGFGYELIGSYYMFKPTGWKKALLGQEKGSTNKFMFLQMVRD